MPLSRRGFLGGAAALGGSSLLQFPEKKEEKCRILRLFLGSRPSWPNPRLDLAAEIRRFRRAFARVRGLEDVEFVGDSQVRDPREAQRYLARWKDQVAGILACNLCLGNLSTIITLAKSGLPTVVFSIPYSGHEWYLIPDMWRAGYKIDVVATSRFDDVVKAIKPIRALWRLRRTKILYVGAGLPLPKEAVESFRAKLGLEIVPYDTEAIKRVYAEVDPGLAEKEADRWISEAEEVVEPSREEIVKASRYYLAMKEVLRREKATVITINCLSAFAQGKLPAYPCLGFSRLNDEGLCGVCEADLPSAVTQVVFLYLEGIPGFVTDPVVDIATNTVIHAHCVSATKMAGPAGPACPYRIRTHLEDLRGASLQVRHQKGVEVTVAKIVAKDTRPYDKRPILMSPSPFDCWRPDQILISTGKIIDSPFLERGCRTKATVKVADAQKMLEGWSYGLHRVLFYGNHMDDVRRFCRFAGIEVTVEG